MGLETLMSAVMANPVTTALGAASLIGQQAASRQAADATDRATAQASANAKATADAAAAAANKPKTPNPVNLYADNLKAAASTELTGPTGVDPASLKLSRTSLLGA